MAPEMSGFGKTSALEAVKHDRKGLVANIFDAAVDDAGCYILGRSAHFGQRPVGDGHMVSSWNFRTRNRSEE